MLIMEIKYRAWRECEKKMYEPITELNFSAWYFSYHWYDFEDEVTENFQFKNTPIMQYTWLDDKNWVEIYEHSIIRTYHQTWKVIKMYWAFGIMINPQEFLTLYDIWDRWDWHKVEVIWNIYENPNLLI